MSLAREWDSQALVAGSAKAVSGFSTQPFESLLASNRSRDRTIAATVLAESSDPKVSQRLMRLTQEPAISGAAILALTGRSDDRSIEFVKFIEDDVQYASVVRNAKKTWNRLLP